MTKTVSSFWVDYSKGEERKALSNETYALRDTYIERFGLFPPHLSKVLGIQKADIAARAWGKEEEAPILGSLEDLGMEADDESDYTNAPLEDEEIAGVPEAECVQSGEREELLRWLGNAAAAGAGAGAPSVPSRSDPSEGVSVTGSIAHTMNAFAATERLKELRKCVEMHGVLRVFLSSPFVGLEKERESIVNYSLEEAKWMCKEAGVSLVVVDLRWGVTSEEDELGLTLDTCLKCIDRSHMFIGMFANRFGASKATKSTWFTRAVDVARQSFPWIENCVDDSMTSLEFRHAFLRRPLNVPCFFLFRGESGNSATASSLGETQQSKHLMERVKEEVVRTVQESKSGVVVNNYSTSHQAAEAARFLSSLLVKKWLSVESASQSASNGVEPRNHDHRRLLAELQAHEDVIRHHSNFHATSDGTYLQLSDADSRGKHSVCGRQRPPASAKTRSKKSTYEELVSFVVGSTSHPAVVLGGHGTGKTAAMSAVARYCWQQQIPIVSVVIGATSQSVVLDNVMESVRFQADSMLENDHERVPSSRPLLIGSGTEYESIPETSTHLQLKVIFDHIVSRGVTRSIVIMFDGLHLLKNSMYDGGGARSALDLDWLPTSVPPNVRLILSANSGSADCADQRILDRLKCRASTIFNVPPLSDEAKTKILDYILGNHQKSLEGAIRKRIVSAHQAGNPLFLVTSTNHMIAHCNFENLNPSIDHILSFSTVTDLFQLVVKSFEDMFGHIGYDPSVVPTLLQTIWASRDGVLESETMEIVNHRLKTASNVKYDNEDATNSNSLDMSDTGIAPKALKQSQWFPLVYAAHGLIVHFQDGETLRFAHRSVRKAVEGLYFPDDTSRESDEGATKKRKARMHRLLLAYFQARCDQPTKTIHHRRWIDEVAYQEQQLGIEPSVIVSMRIRPFLSSDKNSRRQTAITCADKDIFTVHPTHRTQSSFSFDHVFDSHSTTASDSSHATQQSVWRSIGPGIVDTLFASFNVSVVAYGQTGSGKTYSIVGSEKSLTSDPLSEEFGLSSHDRTVGLLPRLCSHIYQRGEWEKRQKGTKVELSVSCIEVYIENVYDMLDDSQVALTPDSHGSQETGRTPVKLRQVNNWEKVEGLTQTHISSGDQMVNIARKVFSRRVSRATERNQFSSRSHLIFTISVKQHGSDGKRTSNLRVVDLAGNERATAHRGEGVSVQETKSINSSLAALNDCIRALAGGEETGYVPYRNSVLTQVLRSSLGGNSKLYLLAHLTPVVGDFHNSYRSLMYAKEAKKIRKFLTRESIASSIGDLEVNSDEELQTIDAVGRQTKSLLDASGPVSTILRIRPLKAHEKISHVSVVNRSVVRLQRPTESEDDRKTFVVDRSLGDNSSQDELFGEILPFASFPIFDMALGVVCYGQTGAGKSTTIFGSGLDVEDGIMCRCFCEILKVAKRMTTSNTTFKFWAQVIQFGLGARDCLVDKQVMVRLAPGQKVTCDALKKEVNNISDVVDVIKLALKNNRIWETNMSTHSGRQSTVCVLGIERLWKDGVVSTGTAMFGDLAGSERVSKAGASGQRLKEAQSIGRSLGSLGNCLSALANGAKHVPYRDSPLSLLLKDSMASGKFVMIGNLNPSDFEESLSTVRMVARCKMIGRKT